MYKCQQDGVRNFDKVSSEGFTEYKHEGSEGVELTGHADNWNIMCQAEGRSSTKTSWQDCVCSRGKNSESGMNRERTLGNKVREVMGNQIIKHMYIIVRTLA